MHLAIDLSEFATPPSRGLLRARKLPAREPYPFHWHFVRGKYGRINGAYSDSIQSVHWDWANNCWPPAKQVRHG
jgi:hypothetical protein